MNEPGGVRGGVRVCWWRDESTKEWWVYLSPDCSDLEYEKMLDDIGVRDAVLVEEGVSEGGVDYLVFADA